MSTDWRTNLIEKAGHGQLDDYDGDPVIRLPNSGTIIFQHRDGDLEAVSVHGNLKGLADFETAAAFMEEEESQ